MSSWVIEVTLHLNKFEFPSPNIFFGQVSLKLEKRIFDSRKCIFTFTLCFYFSIPGTISDKFG